MRIWNKTLLVNTLFIILSAGLVKSCIRNNQQKDSRIETVKIGQIINLMEYSLQALPADSLEDFIKKDSDFKIVSYANMYCEHCWENVMFWKENLRYFKDNLRVSFFCYIHATTEDFILKNTDAQLNFPVFLDPRDRFRIVNHLGNNPMELTFLLNRDNRVLIIGPPFTEDVRQKYLSVINSN